MFNFSKSYFDEFYPVVELHLEKTISSKVFKNKCIVRDHSIDYHSIKTLKIKNVENPNSLFHPKCDYKE